MKESTRNPWAAVSLGIIACMALPAAVLNDPAPSAPAAVQQEQSSAINGKLKSVNVEAQTLEIEGADHEVVVTATTKFGAGLTLGDLKAGDEIRVSGVVRPDGKFEAREIRRQGGAPQSQE
jgi:hypothetical protein